MIRAEVIIVGGGPAGSACAWRLMQSHVDVLVLDQHRFPRLKPCAGWITPQVVRDLELDVASYPGGFTTFRSFQVAIHGFRFKLRTHQHAIRRVEFDDFLLRRSGAPVHVHTVKNIRQEPDGYVIDDAFCARYLVGAGGTYCPVYRNLFKADHPKARESLVVAMEEEFVYPYSDERCHLWFFENRLPGYSWYVPKANGVVNVGVGGKAEELNARGDHLKNHWTFLVEKLERMGLVCGHDYQPVAHSYFVRQNLKQIRKDNAFLAGDAAGLATVDMGEGIGPAIRSGLLAAEAILRDRPYNLSSIPRYSLRSLIGL
ncbi:MAG TPA: NAD(P)/FAD-dependent oxidoreductase [Anaerolineaceae bacterium]|nr:NAD(P)/FAD-dependent oxidoreductase [Anaerolineaceae bacterium]